MERISKTESVYSVNFDDVHNAVGKNTVNNTNNNTDYVNFRCYQTENDKKTTIMMYNLIELEHITAL